MTMPLLTTKLYVPPVRPLCSVVPRPRLIEQLPDYPAFSILVTQASWLQAAQEAARWLAGGPKTQQGTAVLDALDLLEDDQVRVRDSHYAGRFLVELTKKGEGQVLNRSGSKGCTGAARCLKRRPGCARRRWRTGQGGGRRSYLNVR